MDDFIIYPTFSSILMIIVRSSTEYSCTLHFLLVVAHHAVHMDDQTASHQWLRTLPHWNTQHRTEYVLMQNSIVLNENIHTRQILVGIKLPNVKHARTISLSHYHKAWKWMFTKAYIYYCYWNHHFSTTQALPKAWKHSAPPHFSTQNKYNVWVNNWCVYLHKLCDSIVQEK